MFVERNELSKGGRKIDFLGCGEGIGPKLVLEPGDEDREAQGIETGIGQNEIVPQRGDLFLLFRGDVLDLGKYR